MDEPIQAFIQALAEAFDDISIIAITRLPSGSVLAQILVFDTSRKEEHHEKSYSNQ